MEQIKGKHLGGFNMMPAQTGTCPECAKEHDADKPHDQQSLFYQYKFFNDNGRWPTWEDAMAHCTEEVKQVWTDVLRDLGIKIK